MKGIRRFLVLLPVCFILLTGCGKDFLDRQEQEHLTEEKLKGMLKTPSIGRDVLNSQLEAVYRQLYSELGWRFRDDAGRGLRAVMLHLDIMGTDIVENFIGFLKYDYSHEYFKPTDRRTLQYWNKFYAIIGFCNAVMETSFPDPDAVPDALKEMYGQLRAVRGICYYYLVNLYQLPYKHGKDLPAVPLVLNSNSDGSYRATVDKIYQAIIADLQVGIDLLSNTDDNRNDVDKRVAAAYMARVQMEMGNYAQAIQSTTMALDGVANPLYFPSAVNMEYANISTEGMLWGYDVDAQTTFIYGSIYAVFDGTVDGYVPAGMMNYGWNLLVDKIPATDKRSEWFSPGFKKGQEAEYEAYLAKWGGDVTNGHLKYVPTKFHSPKDFTGDYIYLRAADPYLMRIEARIETGDLATAKAELAAFVKVRDKDFNIATVADADLKEFVHLQRRIELWGEGVSWFDLRRWDVGIDRTGPETSHTKDVVKLPPTSLIFAFPLPQGEVDQQPTLGPNKEFYTPGK